MWNCSVQMTSTKDKPNLIKNFSCNYRRFMAATVSFIMTILLSWGVISQMRCLSVLLFCEAAAAVQEKDDGPKGRIRLNSSSFSKWKPILQHPKWRIPNVCTTTISSNQSTRSKRRATIQSLLSPKSHYCSAKLSIHSFCWTSTPAVQILLLTNAIRETDKYSNCHVSQSVSHSLLQHFPFNSGRMDGLMVGLVGWLAGKVSLFIIRLLL